MPADEGPEPDLNARGSGCPNSRGWVFVNTATGDVVPYRCGRNACDYCVEGNARRRARAIALARPERAILLTQVGEDWQVVRMRMGRLRYELTKAIGQSFDWVWHVEPNPKGTGHHVHAWERGAYIAQSTLSAAADGTGMGGFARINRIRNVSDTSSYGLKGLGYGMKGVAAVESRATYLRANGKRLTHQSRGFFVDCEGDPAGVRDAERAAATVGREQVGEWVLMTSGVTA